MLAGQWFYFEDSLSAALFVQRLLEGYLSTRNWKEHGQCIVVAHFKSLSQRCLKTKEQYENLQSYYPVC